MYTLSTLNTLFITASNNSISIEINKACTFIFAEYKNTMAKIEIKSSTTAKDNKKIFKDILNRFLENYKFNDTLFD